MLRYNFEYEGQQITIYSSAKVADATIGRIANLIHFADVDLHANQLNADINTFNNASVGQPITVSEDFINFLKHNIDLSVESDFLFFPFEGVSPKLFQKLFMIEKSGDMIKLKPIKLDASILNDEYLVEKIHDELKDNGIPSFLIRYSNIYFAYGSELFETDFIRQDRKQERIKLENNCCCFYFNGNFHREIAYERIKFGSKDKPILPQFVAVIGKTPTICKRAYVESRNYSMFGEIRNVAFHDDVEFRITTDAGEEVDIKKSKEFEINS